MVIRGLVGRVALNHSTMMVKVRITLLMTGPDLQLGLEL